MTLEEALAKNAELETSVEKLTGKNREVIQDNTRLKAKSQEIDVDKYATDMVNLENMTTQNATLTKQVEDGTALQTQLKELAAGSDAKLRTYMTDNELTAALITAKVKPEFIGAAKAMLQSGVTVADTDAGLVAQMGEKSIADGIAEWALSDSGKHFVVAPENAGGGADGGVTPPAGGQPQANKKAEEASKSGDSLAFIQANLGNKPEG
jgi:hypothetical protein